MTAVEYTLFEEYTDQQLYQILLGMKQNVDVIQYADPQYSEWQMLKIREALSDGLDVSILLDHRWDNDMTSVLQFALYDGLDLLHYANEGYSADQIQEIHKGYLSGVDVNAYSYQVYSAGQMRQLRLAMEEGINYLIFRDPLYPPESMSILRTALKNGYDIADKFNPSMTYQEISQVLLTMVDSRKYAQYVVSRDLRNVERVASSEDELIELLKKKGYEITQDEDSLFVIPPGCSAAVEIEYSEDGHGCRNDSGNKVYYSLPFWQSDEFDVLWQEIRNRATENRER